MAGFKLNRPSIAQSNIGNYLVLEYSNFSGQSNWHG